MTNHNNPQYREQLEGRIAFYIARLQEGIPLTWQEHRDLRHLKRELHYIDHRARVKQKTILFRTSYSNIRNCLDQGVL